jgi:hypothetical protein
MPTTMTFQHNFSALGKSAVQRETVTVDNTVVTDANLNAAKTGTLSTRTDDNTGTLTMDTGHGITTGATIDLYWSGGSRRGVTVGTVATNSVPIDLGSGDNLPIATTAITAMVVIEETSGWAIAGNDIEGIIAGCPKPYTIVFLDGSDAELFAIVETSSSGGGYGWNSESGITNPLAGDTVAKIRKTHGDSTAARAVTLAVGTN